MGRLVLGNGSKNNKGNSNGSYIKELNRNIKELIDTIESANQNVFNARELQGI